MIWSKMRLLYSLANSAYLLTRPSNSVAHVVTVTVTITGTVTEQRSSQEQENTVLDKQLYTVSVMTYGRRVSRSRKLPCLYNQTHSCEEECATNFITSIRARCLPTTTQRGNLYSICNSPGRLVVSSQIRIVVMCALHACVAMNDALADVCAVRSLNIDVFTALANYIAATRGIVEALRLLTVCREWSRGIQLHPQSCTWCLRHHPLPLAIRPCAACLTICARAEYCRTQRVLRDASESTTWMSSPSKRIHFAAMLTHTHESWTHYFDEYRERYAITDEQLADDVARGAITWVDAMTHYGSGVMTQLSKRDIEDVIALHCVYDRVSLVEYLFAHLLTMQYNDHRFCNNGTILLTSIRRLCNPVLEQWFKLKVVKHNCVLRQAWNDRCFAEHMYHNRKAVHCFWPHVLVPKSCLKDFVSYMRPASQHEAEYRSVYEAQRRAHKELFLRTSARQFEIPLRVHPYTQSHFYGTYLDKMLNGHIEDYDTEYSGILSHTSSLLSSTKHVWGKCHYVGFLRLLKARDMYADEDYGFRAQKHARSCLWYGLFFPPSCHNFCFTYTKRVRDVWLELFLPTYHRLSRLFTRVEGEQVSAPMFLPPSLRFRSGLLSADIGPICEFINRAEMHSVADWVVEVGDIYLYGTWDIAATLFGRSVPVSFVDCMAARLVVDIFAALHKVLFYGVDAYVEFFREVLVFAQERLHVGLRGTLVKSMSFEKYVPELLPVIRERDPQAMTECVSRMLDVHGVSLHTTWASRVLQPREVDELAFAYLCGLCPVRMSVLHHVEAIFRQTSRAHAVICDDEFPDTIIAWQTGQRDCWTSYFAMIMRLRDGRRFPRTCSRASFARTVITDVVTES